MSPDKPGLCRLAGVERVKFPEGVPGQAHLAPPEFAERTRLFVRPLCAARSENVKRKPGSGIKQRILTDPRPQQLLELMEFIRPLHLGLEVDHVVAQADQAANALAGFRS